MDDMKTTGSRIRELRLKLDMTQEEFAHSLGITVSTVNRWENGHSEPSKLARASIVGLAEKRGVTIDSTSLEMPRLTEATGTLHAFAR
jgi:DNA-binding transcriptional regulator YiaG